MDIFNRSGAKRKQIAELNLETYAEKATELFGLSPDDYDAAMLEYRHFLYLAYWNRRLEQRLMVVPTKRADKLWHAHILYTREYREMCALVFGQPLDHSPGLTEGSDAFNVAMRHTRDVHNHIKKLGKDPGFDKDYFAFLDTSPTAKYASSRKKREDDGDGYHSSSPIITSNSHSDSSDSGFQGEGGRFGGGGASSGWESDSGSSPSDSGGSSGGGCGGGCGG